MALAGRHAETRHVMCARAAGVPGPIMALAMRHPETRHVMCA